MFMTAFGAALLATASTRLSNRSTCVPDNACLRSASAGHLTDAYPPYVHVVGIDLSLDMLEHAKNKIRENGWTDVELSQGDALTLEAPDNSFEVVTPFT